MITTAVNVCNPVSVVFKSNCREHCGSSLHAARIKEIWFITLSLPQHGDFPLQILLRYHCTRMGHCEVTVTFIFDGKKSNQSVLASKWTVVSNLNEFPQGILEISRLQQRARWMDRRTTRKQIFCPRLPLAQRQDPLTSRRRELSRFSDYSLMWLYL